MLSFCRGLLAPSEIKLIMNLLEAQPTYAIYHLEYFKSYFFLTYNRQELKIVFNRCVSLNTENNMTG